MQTEELPIATWRGRRKSGDAMHETVLTVMAGGSGVSVGCGGQG